MNACHNRKPFTPTTRVQDGWQNSWARNMVDMEFRGDPSCVYSTSQQGKEDKGCIGCKWRANGQADTGAETSAEPVAKPSGLAGIRAGEGEVVGGEGADGLRDSAEAAEAKRRFEEAWPQAAIYQPTEE